MSTIGFDLRSWLRKAPKPARLRLHTADGEERFVELGDKRFKWIAVEETVRTAGAAKIEALDKDGSILRATRLSEEETDAEDDHDARGKYDERLLAKDRLAMAAMLDRYGARMSEAFAQGAKAASASQDKLVNLVEVLTEHLTLAITNLHNVSVNLANVVQAAAEGEGNSDKNGALLTGLLSRVLTQGAIPPPTAKGPPKP